MLLWSTFILLPFLVHGQKNFSTVNGTVTLQPGSCRYENQNRFVRMICYHNNTRFMKCPHSDVLYVAVKDLVIVQGVSGNSDKFDVLCPGDNLTFYQACGEKFYPTVQRTPSIKLLCGTFVCQNTTNNISYSGENEYSKYNCNNQTQCTTGIDELGCPENAEYYTCSMGRVLLKSKVCDGRCDCFQCADESQCEGYTYGRWCFTKWGKYVYRQPSFFKCVKKPKDQGDCTLNYDCKKVPSCPFIKNTKTLKPLINETRCHTQVLCINKLDQTNCSNPNKTPLKCQINNYTSTVSKNIICNPKISAYKSLEHLLDGVSVCDDGMDMLCVSPSPVCYIHKHNLCDNKTDCIDGSDELNCDRVMNHVCVRKMGYKLPPMKIPLQFVNDGIDDCIDGLDEKKGIWETCQYGDFERIVVPGTTCDDVYICRNEHPGFIELKDLCDKIDTCGNENEVCSAAQGAIAILNRLITYLDRFHVSYCVPGFNDLIKESCKHAVFPEVRILGTQPNKMLIPTNPTSCKYFYGEAYVFLACSGLCKDALCPLKHPLTYQSCPQQFKNRVYSLVNNDYLTFVKPFKTEFKVQNIFTCRNFNCIPYQKVCDLVDDCGDDSDEINCSNHFVCNQNNSEHRRRFIPLSSVCDEKIDCLDLSDECNALCKRDIIETVGLKLSCFIIGVLAVMFNLFIMKNNVLSLKYKEETPLSLLNKILIILIGFGDLLVGLYLLVIAIVDQLKSHDFCTEQQEWRVSVYCDILGVVSTTGSQLSLFSMTVLSLVRVYGIRRGLSALKILRIRHIVCFLVLVGALLSISVGISILPLLPSLKDWFINALYIPDIPLFKGFPEKIVVQKTALAYYGRSRLDSQQMSWDRIEDLVKNMFTRTASGVYIERLSFYGASPVCLFKYFVKPNEPQKLFSWTILVVNFISFCIITLAYVMINVLSRSSAAAANGNSGSGNSKVIQRNRRLQRKISLIIFTDFLCWVPFIFISFLHSMEVINATSWYGILSVVILPINSVINPLLYDDYIGKQAGFFVKFVSRRTEKLSFKGTQKSETNESTL